MIFTLRRKTCIVCFAVIIALFLGVLAGAGIRSVSGPAARAASDCAVIVDPGHGGPDGGAKAGDMEEKHLNLDISLRLKKILEFFGYHTVMTRTKDESTSGARFSKARDLRERARIASLFPNAPFISIHMNKYPDDAPWGTQVFYSKNHDGSKAMASFVQEEVRGLLQPKNHRQIKPSPDGVYLMKAIKNPAIIVECGFLSNPPELERLRDDNYRSGLAFGIACGYLRYENDKKKGARGDGGTPDGSGSSGAELFTP